MSARTITRFILVCDGCGAETTEYPNSTEGRAAAYTEGWRFPNMVNVKGKPVRRVSDACPECIKDWKPLTDPQSEKWTPERKASHGEQMRRLLGRTGD